jgi:IPT/TIG domain
VLNSARFTYSPPSVLSIDPQITHGNNQAIQISIEYNGITTSTVMVTIITLPSRDESTCTGASFVSSSSIQCQIGNLQHGNFTVKVQIGNQYYSGDVYAFNAMPPTISSISPLNGPALGGTPITITVSNLFQFKNITFSHNLGFEIIILPATNCSQQGFDTINCLTPAVPLPVIFSVNIIDGDFSNTFTPGFTYDPAFVTSINPDSGAGVGGYNISIYGVNFGTGCCALPVVIFDKAACSNPKRVNDSLITCTVPPVRLD